MRCLGFGAFGGKVSGLGIRRFGVSGLTEFVYGLELRVTACKV